MPSHRTPLRAGLTSALRRTLPWVLALAVATCTDDQTGPSRGGTGYFSFRPVYGISSSLSQFGVVADSVHIRLTRPVDQVVLDTTVFFSPDSSQLRLALPIQLQQSPESLSAVIEIKAGATVLFLDSLDVQVSDGPPSASQIPTVLLDYVGPGKNVASIALDPTDTTIVLGDTLFFTATAQDSSAQPVTSFYVAWKTSDSTVARINAQGRLIAPLARGSVQVIGYTPTGIADTTVVTFAPVPTQILADSGNTQGGLVGDSLGALFVAKVIGADNIGISGIDVRFTAITAGGTIRDTLLTTDANGRVRTRGVLGTTAGAYSYSATVVGTAVTTNFTATATSGVASAIAIQAGNLQSDSAGRVLATPFTVRVADAFNNPVTGAKVYWLRTAGTGTLAVDSSFTNTSGLATSGYTLGAVGVDSVTATLAGTSAFVAFQATAINGAAASVTKLLGDAQSDTVGRLLADSLAVIVRSATSQPVVGVPVVWTVLRGGATSSDSTFTDATGRAAVAYTLGTVSGIDSVRAQAGGASAIFTATAATGQATTLVISSGDAQTDTAGKALPLPFVVHATDTFGNSVAGTQILFAVTAGTGALADDTVATDVAGLASVGYTLGGPGIDSISATLLCACSSVTFTATAISAAPASLVIVQGDSQTVTVNTIADTFAVLVRDGANGPLAGVEVTWTFIPAVGSFTEILPSGIQQTLTDSLGVARGIYTAGTSAGTVRVEAQVGALIDSIYLFAVAAAPTTIAIQAGDGQADTVGNAIPLPFVARVTDAFGNPVAGAWVLFARIAGSGTLFADSVATNASGQAAVGYLFGAVPGVNTIRATLSGTSAFVDFQATAIAAVPASISVISGDGQTAAVTEAFTDSLEVEVQDGGGTPIVGHAVVWTMASGGTLSDDTTFTDINGRTSVRVTAGAVAGPRLVRGRAVGLGSTADFTLNIIAGAPSSIALVGGNGQVDTVGSTLPAQLVVFATDSFGNYLVGAAVTFVRTFGVGTLVPDSTVTDATGNAAVSYVLGSTAGTDTIVATLVGTSSTVTFTATGIPATVAALQIVSGDAQSDTVGRTITPLVVRAVDASSVPVAGVPVVWNVIRGGSLLSDTVVTDSLGLAQNSYTLGTLPGIDSVQAQSGAGAAIFTATALAGAPSGIAILSGNGQSDTTGRTLASPLTVAVTDAFSNPVAGAAVLFTVQAGTGTLSADTVFTDALGQASASYTLGATPALDTVRATLIGTSAFVDFTASSISGAPALLAKLLGDTQVDTVLSTLTDSLIVQLVDGSATPVPNTWLYWVAGGATLSADSTLTDVNGRAAVQATFGSVAVPVSVIVFNADTTIATGFTLTATAGAPSAITAVAGLGQTAVVNTSLPIDFGAFVQDAYGNPAPGVNVTWTNLAGFAAAGLPDTTITDSTGVAFLTAPLLGPIVGEDSLEAQILGAPATALFTATSTAGAASSLVYVSGTGQSDTVASVLSIAPYVVQVRDAGSNPVAGIWVRFQATTGGGSFDVDSVQSDLSGVASAIRSLGTTVGIDSSIVTIAASADTVHFYAIAISASVKLLVKVSGDLQSGTVGTALGAPLVVRTTDQFGNTISGVPIVFEVTGGGGTVDSATATTDGTGFGNSGTWTLGAVAGANQVRVTMPVVPEDTLLFDATALPIGTSKQWLGTASSDWGDPANWSPAILPTTSDNVFVPASAPNQPVLDLSRTIGGLAVESGADLNVQGNILTLNGTLVADGTISRSSGHTILAGTSVTARGTIGAIQSTGSVTLNGPTTIESNLLVTAGSFTIGGQTLTVNGSVDVSGGGQFRMVNAADSVRVTAASTWAGSTSTGLLSAGVLVFESDLSESSGSFTFRASGTHRTVFAGTSPQSVSLLGAALGGDQFQDVVFANPSGVDLVGSLAVGGTATILSGNVTGTGSTAFLGGSLVDAGSPNWLVSITTLAGSPTTLPDTLPLDVTSTGTVTLVAPLVVNGSWNVSNGSLTLSGNRLQVDGNFSTASVGQLRMQNVLDTLEIGGTTSFGGSASTGLLTAGNLILHGDLAEVSGSATFRASGTHTTTFAGPGAQAVSFISPGLGVDQFQNVIFASAGGVVLNSNFAAAGDAAITAGTLTGAGRTATIVGNVVDATGISWAPETTLLAGSPALLPDSFPNNVEVTGAVTLPHDLVVRGALAHTGGSLILGGFTLRIDSTLTVSGAAALRMQSATDSLIVGGSTSWGGSSSTGFLTAGTAVFLGNFSELSGSATYRASAGHKTLFAGSAPQTVSFISPGIGSDQFRNVEFANPTSVTLLSGFAAAGTASVTAGVVDGAGQTAIVAGDLIDASGTAWRLDTTDLAGTTVALPIAISRTLKVSGSVTLSNDVAVHGNLLQTAGNLILNGHTLTVDSGLAVSGAAQFRMQNAADSLDVGGATTWAGSGSVGFLTSGTAVFRGDFSELSGSSTYRAGNTHRTVFAGSAAQSVSFVSPGLGGDQFQHVTFANPAGVAITDFAVAGTATVTDGPVTSPGTAFLAGTVTDTANSFWRPELTTFTVAPAAFPDSFARSISLTGTVTLLKPLVVGGQLTVAGGLFTPNGFFVRADSGLSVTGSAQFVMGNAADSVDVTGAALWSGSTAAGLLTNGVLILRGDLTAPAGVPTFQPSGAHRTRFTTGLHTVAFPASSGFAGNRFQELEVSNPSNVSTATDLYVAGTFRNIAGPTGNLIGSGTQRLVTRGLAVNNWNFDGIRVEYHGPVPFQLDNANFLNQDPTLVQLDIRTAGGPPVTLSDVSFTTTPTTGRYIAAADTAANSQPVAIAMFRSLPLDGSAFELQVAGSDGATIDWSRLVFADQPLDIAAAGTLAPVRVALLNPAGDTASWFTSNISVAIGTNPAGGTLGGTTTQGATSGIATFSDLTIDNAGFGYTLNASTLGAATLSSATFNVTVPLPAGFTTQWTGQTDGSWSNPANWSGAIVPDSTTNVFISTVASNPATIPSGTVTVNRLQLAPSATLDIASGATLVADSSVEAGTTITGAGLLVLRGNGDLTGTVTAPIRLDGTYSVVGTAAVQFLDIYGDLYLAADTLTVSGAFGTYGGTGRIHSTSADALIDDAGPAWFEGGSTTGTLTLGTLRVGGDLVSAPAGAADAFAPSAGHITVLNGSGVQTVNFFTPDSVTGSHFGRLQVSTVGTGFMLGRYSALGDLLIASGATLADSLVVGFEALGFTTIDAGGTLDVNNFRTRGGIGVAVGASYSVATTTYYGGGAFPINPAPYDTLVLQLQGQATADFAISGDLRLTGIGAGLDLNAHTVSVGGSVDINNGANLTMQNAADILNVAGSFFTNGDSTKGLLTNGLLQIGGSFRQAADGSGESFRASGSHTTRFTGGVGARQIAFDSPSFSPTDLGGSHFAILDLSDGVDSLGGRVPAAVSLSIGGSVTYDTTGSGYTLASYGPTNILASSDSLSAQTLESWGDLTRAGSGVYDVELTRLMGGSGGTLPALPYQSLLIANTTFTLAGDLALPGSLDVGIYCSEICTSSGGQLTLGGGNTVVLGGALNVMGLGHLTMAAGDSVDVTGATQFRTIPEAGHFTGGTLVVRGRWNTVGSGAFQADAGHTTVFLAPGVEDIYPTSNTWFGDLTLLDGGPRRVRSSSPLQVNGTLTLGSNTSGLNDTLGFGSGYLLADGPVLTVVGSSILMEGSVRFNNNSLNILGGYSAANTIFGGSSQIIPALTYTNVTVVGTAQLAAGLDIGTGNFTVDGSAGAADIDLNGQMLQVGDFTVTGNATLTSTTGGSGLVVRGNATFNGADETGRLTEGGVSFKGSFTQDSMTSLSSYVSSGNHTTVFADSGFGGSAAVLNSMTNGESRFNQLAVYGNGVTFYGNAWVDGSINMLDPLLGDSVRASEAVRIAGTLNDPNNRWKVDTTIVVSASAVLPDSIDKHLTFDTDYTLTNLLRVGGIVQIHDTLAIAGYTLLGHNSLVVEGAGLLQMTNPTDEVVVDGVSLFNGAPTGALMSAGRLTLRSSMFVTGTGAFNATGTHTTVLASPGSQTLSFAGGPQGYGFNDVVTYTTALTLSDGALVRGTFRDSVAGQNLDFFGTDSTLTAHRLELNVATINDLRLVMGDSSQVDTLSVLFSDPEGKSQLKVVGAARSTPLDFHAIVFNNLPTSGYLLEVQDTAFNGVDTLMVRMFGTTPFDGSTLTLWNGGYAQWSRLALSAPLPATFDSLVPFGITMRVREPDGSNRADVIGTVNISLVNGGTATLGGPTSATFDGQSAQFDNLTLDQLVTGASFYFEMQSSAIDNITTGTFDVINPAPTGANNFTGVTSPDWSDGSNWSTLSVPSPADDVFIPGGKSVFIPPASTYIVNTLVLGTGADLDLGAGSTLTVNGNLAAGQTITGPGTLYLAGGAGTTITGSIASPTMIQGQITTVGTVTFGSDLTVDGAGADLNIGGAKVVVGGIFSTANGGILTMDGGTDSLIAGEVAFNGGSTIGTLSAGTLRLTGTDFSQAGPSPSAFQPSGSFTVVFEDGGANTNVFFNDPDSSYFQHLVVNTPNSVLLSSLGSRILVGGDLTLDADGALTGDTLKVSGTMTMEAASSLTMSELRLGSAPVLAGSYNVLTTWYYGAPVVIPAAPVLYERLYVDNSATLGSDLLVRTLLITGNGQVDVNSYNLLADSLYTTASGRLVMDAAEDTVLVADSTAFLGGNESGLLTDGVLRLGGGFFSTGDQFIAYGNHVTEFFSGIPKTITVSPVASCDGPCPLPVQFGILKIDGTSVSIEDPQSTGFTAGELFVTGSTVAAPNVALQLGGDFHADVTSALTFQSIGVPGTVDVQVLDGSFSVGTMVFQGSGQLIPDLNYQQIIVVGGVLLADTIDATGVTVGSVGVLDMNGMPMTVTGTFVASGASHLLMQDPADTLVVNGTAVFSADSTFGDFTAGAIRAFTFWQQTGTTGRGFQETGSHRVIPVAGGTIRMDDAGPGTSYLQTIDFGRAGGPVTVQGIWITDSMILTDPATSVAADTGLLFMVEGTYLQTAGAVNIPRLATRGTVAYSGGSYVVDTTVFAGSGQYIPTNVPYANINVQYDAQLTGDLAIQGRTFTVENSGSLDLAGHKLDLVNPSSSTGLFQTKGFGVVVMDSSADILQAYRVTFDGGNTVGRLTAGTIRTSIFQQLDAQSVYSFAPSDSHHVELVPLGFVSEGSYPLSLAGSASDTTSHFQNLRVVIQVAPSSDLFVADTFYLNATLNAPARTIVVGGFADLGSGANGSLDTLRVLGALNVDPSSTLTIANTVFGPAAAPMPNVTAFSSNVIIEGAQTLSSPLTVGGNLYVKGSGVLTLNGRKVSGAIGLFVEDNARLVMTNVADTVEVGDANFSGGDQSGYLTSGVLRVGGSFTQNNSTSALSFASTGTRTEFYGAGTHSATFANPLAASSRFADLAILDGGTLQPTTSIYVSGATTIDTSSIFDEQLMPGGAQATFIGKVNLLDLAQMLGPSGVFGTVEFRDSLIVAPTATYSVLNTIFQGTDGIPNVTYTHLYLRQGVHLTLTHRLFMFGGLNIQNAGNPADTVRLRLNGNKVTANGMYVDGYARITMDSMADTLEVGGDVTFRGIDQDTAMSAGIIRIGGYLQQIGTNSIRSFAPAGTLTEFYGSGVHNALFANPISGGSHFGPLAVVNTGTLRPTAGFIVIGATTIGAGAHFDGQSIPNGNTADFFGPVSVLAGGDFQSGASQAYFNFYGANPLTVANGATTPYSVINTGFSNTGNSLPDLPYQNLYLTDGVHDTLTFTPTITGLLSLSALNPGAQDFVLNGRTLNVAALATQGEGRFDMTNGADLLNVAGTATFDGGDLTGRLTAGVLTIGGNFSQNGGAATAFVADSGHTTQFGGTGTHQVYFSTPSAAGSGGSHFGSLSFATDAGLVLDVQSGIWVEGTLTTTGGSTPTLQNGTVPLLTLTAQDVNIQGITFDHVQFHLAKTTGVAAGAGSMDIVTFQNFLTTEDQFLVDLPGESSQYSWSNFTFTQLDLGGTDTGRYIVATDTDGGIPNVLSISLGTSQASNPSNYFVGVNGAVISPFAP